MPVPEGVYRWLNHSYPKPTVDRSWLNGCFEYIFNENPDRTLNEIIACVEELLLSSDFSDSMLPNTGFPQNVADIKDTRLQGPILVEVVDIMEFGHSAFNLMNVRQMRIDKAELAGLERDDENEEERYEDPEDEGPIPNYPRSILKLQLSDGHTVIPAFEFRRIPELILGETPLGCKMLLKDVLIRKGMALLDPRSVTFKGHRNDDRVVTQDRNFLTTLKFRMGLPIDDPNDVREEDQHNDGPPPNNETLLILPPQQPSIRRSPFHEIAEPPEPNHTLTDHADEDNVTLRRRVSTIHHSLNPSSLSDAAVEERRSRYFSSQSSTSKTLADNNQDVIFSPLRRSTTAVERPSSPVEEKIATSSALCQPKSESQPTRRSTDADIEVDDMEDLEVLAFWEHLAKAENAVKNQISEKAPTPEPVPSTSGSRLVSDTPQISAAIPSSVVAIEDNEDKQNIPVPARRVRRRFAQPPVEEVIEISD